MPTRSKWFRRLKASVGYRKVGSWGARLRQRLGRRLASYLARVPPATPDPAALEELERIERCLRPGDILLIEGRNRFSTAIKYLTQSTWSHAALYVGEQALAHAPGKTQPAEQRCCIVEADLVEGVRAVALSHYAGLSIRICRAANLRTGDVERVLLHVTSRLGHRYDLKHIFDLMRWLLPKPPVPVRFRRRLLTLGSGDPTRAICSALVAEAFQAIRYPILPAVRRLRRIDASDGLDLSSEVLASRHASLFVPRDFDLSPYFEIVKPSLLDKFDHRRVRWEDAYWDPPEPSIRLAPLRSDELPPNA